MNKSPPDRKQYNPHLLLYRKTYNSTTTKLKKRKTYDLFPTNLYIFVEIAMMLVTTARMTIAAAIILSLLVEMPWISLPKEKKNKWSNLTAKSQTKKTRAI